MIALARRQSLAARVQGSAVWLPMPPLARSSPCRTTRASAIIDHVAHIKPTEFVPGRGFNGFDQIYCRTGTYKAKLVLANLTFRVHHLPAHLRSRRIYLLDGRGGQPAAIETTLSNFEQRLDNAGYRSRPLRDLH